MGKKRMKHLNELRFKAMAGDRLAQQTLAAELYVPHHLRGGNKMTALRKRMGIGSKQGMHVTAKTLQAVRCFVTTTMAPDYGLDRLQMLVDRRARREARA